MDALGIIGSILAAAVMLVIWFTATYGFAGGVANKRLSPAHRVKQFLWWATFMGIFATIGYLVFG